MPINANSAFPRWHGIGNLIDGIYPDFDGLASQYVAVLVLPNATHVGDGFRFRDHPLQWRRFYWDQERILDE